MAACREALKERTREHVPRPWAMTKNNLNTVSCSVGSAPENLKKCERTREGAARLGVLALGAKAAPVSKGFGGARGMLRNSRISHANLDVAISTA